MRYWTEKYSGLQSFVKRFHVLSIIRLPYIFDDFIKCFEQYLEDDYTKLQNLGEGFDYNCGTIISKQYFPLKKDVYEAIR